MKRNCDTCGKEYTADIRAIKRGWGLCCSKSCAATKREKSKIGYNAARVEYNNRRRENWNKWILDKSEGDIYHVVDSEGKFKGRTSEGYRIFGNVAYDQWGDPVYEIN